MPPPPPPSFFFFLFACLLYCSTGIYEVRGDACSADLHLSLVELPEVSECCVSVESVTEAFPLPVFCLTGHSLEHFCLFFEFDVHFNCQVWVWLAAFFLPQLHQCPLASPCCLGFLVPLGWLDDSFLSGIYCVSCIDLMLGCFFFWCLGMKVSHVSVQPLVYTSSWRLGISIIMERIYDVDEN